MKSLIIFFSQTGNTKKIALAIQKGIIAQTGQCDIKSLKEATAADWLDYDLVGIGSSTWSSCPNPRLIYMVKELPEEVKGKHAFFFSTHGILPGRVVHRGVKPMLDKGLTVLGWKDWFCGASLPGHLKPWYSDGHPDEIDLAEAEAFGKTMAEHSQRVNDGWVEIIPKLPTPEAFDQFYGTGHPFIQFAHPTSQNENGEEAPAPAPGPEEEPEPYTLRWPTTMSYVMELEGITREGAPHGHGIELHINPEKCIHCHRCVKACWCDNIDGSTEVPTFKSKNCEMCLFCEGVCPTGALEVPFREPSSPEEDRARAKGPYGMALQLDLCEAMGSFRRKLSLDDVGYGHPWESVSGHPRHKEIP